MDKEHKAYEIQAIKTKLERGDHFIDTFVDLTLEEITNHTYEEFINLLNRRSQLMWLPYDNIKYYVESCSKGFFYATIRFKIRFYVNKEKFYEQFKED